jgi:hypothetical protein
MPYGDHVEQIKAIREEYERELLNLRRNLQEFTTENAFKDENYLAMINEQEPNELTSAHRPQSSLERAP